MATAVQSNIVSSARESTDNIPWYIWCAIAAVTSVAIGGNWDISWHMSIGRDTFWTPAHMAIYLCGVLAGVAFGYIVLSTTFSRSAPLADASVHIWGLRAPLGAFIASWGGLTMLVSAPFDNWWHNAYGLDVKIISPPHIVLFIGIYGVLLGTIVLIAGHIRRAHEPARTRGRYLLLYSCAIMLIVFMTMVMEYTSRIFLHGARAYVVVSMLAPVMLTVAARASGMRFAATCVAGIYTLFGAGLIWILPLFPAEPKLGPVYQHITHFIPEQFPLLLIVPAFALDLLWQRTKSWNGWTLSAASALVFVLFLVAAEWPFATFLMTPGARNAFFGAAYYSYDVPPTSHLARHLFIEGETAAQFWRGMALALVLAALSFRFGLSRGDWLRTVER